MPLPFDSILSGRRLCEDLLFAKEAVQPKPSTFQLPVMETPDEMQGELVALCRCMDVSFGYVGHYQAGRITSVSPSVQSLLGYPQEYFLQGGVDALRRIVHPHDMPGIVLTLSAFCKAYQGRYKACEYSQMPGTAHYFFRLKHSDGRWLPVTQQVFVLRPFENGMPDLHFAVVNFCNEASNYGEREKEWILKERHRLQAIHPG